MEKTLRAGGLVAIVVLCSIVATYCNNDYVHCDLGLSLCGDECVNLDTSEIHCGSCANDCGDNASCHLGKCICDEGYTDCDSGCASLEWDRNNCGQCGTICKPTEQCLLGACCWGYPDCADFGLEICKNADGCLICVDTDSSNDHCGECYSTCTQDEICVKGVCVLHGCYENEDCAEDEVCLSGECRGAWGLTYRLTVEQIELFNGCEEWDLNSCPDITACFLKDVDVFPGSLDTAEFCTSVVYDAYLGRWPDEPFDTVLTETDDWTLFVLDEDNDGWDVIRDDIRLNPFPLDSIHFGSLVGPSSDVVIFIEPVSE